MEKDMEQVMKKAEVLIEALPYDPHWWSEQKQVCPQQAPAIPDRAAQ